MQINSLLKDLNEKYLYLLELELTNEIIGKFAGIKYVLLQGSNDRAKNLARKLALKFSKILPAFFEPKDITPTSRYKIYRVGNVLSVSHGMGNTSVIALLHDLTKILYYAGNTELEYIRVGTSGGIGVDPGTVVITEKAFMPTLVDYLPLPSLDKNINTSTIFDSRLANEIYKVQPRGLDFQVILANTIAADDFYLGQGRFDGAINPKYDHNFRSEYFEKVRALGIRNFEMESTALAAFCNQVEIPATMLAVTLVNRLVSDQVTATPEELAEFSDRSQLVAINYLNTKSDLI